MSEKLTIQISGPEGSWDQQKRWFELLTGLAPLVRRAVGEPLVIIAGQEGDGR